jgi:hypothetical protein
MKTTGFTYKSYPREKGLAAVGEGTPSIAIKYKKEEVGTIDFNNGAFGNGKLTVRFKVKADEKSLIDNPNVQWRWQSFKKPNHVFQDSNEIKEWLQSPSVINLLVSQIYFEKESNEVS